MLFRRAVMVSRSSASRRMLSSSAPPQEYGANVSRNNAIVGLSLATFVASVFYYTVTRMQAVSTLGSEFDEKLNKPCDSCNDNSAKKQ